ncbi:4346_t:CDS:2, partial [Gigaspora margarita]
MSPGAVLESLKNFKEHGTKILKNRERFKVRRLEQVPQGLGTEERKGEAYEAGYIKKEYTQYKNALEVKYYYRSLKEDKQRKIAPPYNDFMRQKLEEIIERIMDTAIVAE